MSMLLMISFTAKSQQESTCPVPGSNCIPTYKATSILPDTAYFNCDLSKILDPGLDKSGAILYKWTAPDGTTSSGVNKIVKPDLEGYYTLCYDTADPSVNSCPRSDRVYVTKFTKKFANGGPDISTCSNTKTLIGANVYNPSYQYQWGPPTLLIGKADSNYANIYFPNNSPNPFNAKVNVTYTEKKTGCKDSDTIRVTIFPLPILKIEKLQSNYCAGEKSIIRLVAYYPTFDKFTAGFSIDGVPQVLPAPKDTNISIKVNSSFTSFPAKVYEYPLIASKSGNIPLSFTFKSNLGCPASKDTIINVNTPSANISIKGLQGFPYCGENTSDLVPLTAFNGATQATLGKFEINPDVNGAITKDANNNYFFNPSKATPGVNTITYTEPKTSPTACGATGTGTVTILPKPEGKIRGRTSVCPGALGAEYKDTSTYPGLNVTRTWDVTSNADIVSIHNPEGDSVVIDYKTIPGQAVIGLTIDLGNGCSKRIEYPVTIEKAINSQPPIGDSVFCTGFDSVLYFAEPGSKHKHQWFVRGGELDAKYKTYSDAQSAYVKWNPGAPEYWLWVRDSNTVDNTCFGNSDTLKIKFTQDPFAKILTPDSSTVCTGLPFTIEADPEGGNTFLWSPGNLTGPTITVSPTVTTKYTLTVGKGTACADKTNDITLFIQPLPKDPLPQADFEACFEEVPEIVLTAEIDQPANTIVWNGDPDETGNTFIVKSAGTYKAVQTDAFGCPMEGSVTIRDNCPVRIYVPEAFSPNQDGSNDTLRIFGNSNFENFQLKIFNRWGEVIYSANDVNVHWGGEYNGKQAPTGTYPWVITYEVADETKKKERIVKKGSISLIR